MNDLSVERREDTETKTDNAAAVEETHWSDRAQRRLMQARALGLIMAVIGASLFVIGNDEPTALGNFAANGGLTLLVSGLVVIAAAVRTRGALPQQPFAPGSIVNPRMWFSLVWGGGIVFAVLFLVNGGPVTTTEQILMLILSTALMIIGGFWILRWLSGQLARQWPLDSARGAQLSLRWVPSWTIIWSGVWGLVSTLLALVIESAPVIVLALLFRSSSNVVPRSSLSPYESLVRVFRNPILLAVVIFGAVVAAPLIEEAVKALGLRWLRPWIQRPVDGWLLGFAAGLGFGVLEGAFNLDSAGSWFVGGWVRLAALLLHGLATSLTGLGYARYLQSKQRSDLWSGYRRAVILHGVWNACAIGIAVAFGTLGVGVFFNGLAACVGFVIFIGLITFMVLLLRRVSTAGVQTSIQEDFQQAGVALPMGWRPMKFNLGWRWVGSRPIDVPVTVRSDSPVTSEARPDETYIQRVEDELKDE